MFESSEHIITANGHGELIRESQELFDRLVDPMDAYRDPLNGEMWLPIGGNADHRKNRPALDRAGFKDDLELEQARNYCRVIAEKNEYVIAAQENRISYVVGEGHGYNFVVKKGFDADPGKQAEAQKWLDDWLYESKWSQRQIETVRRRDRDGESFLRYFVKSDGTCRVRFVEPWQVRTPPGNDPNAMFGIQTDKDDVEDIEGYWIDGELVDAYDVQHRKANVDLNVRRGMMTFWPVRRTLNQIDELCVFLAHLAKVRAAYAAIRVLKGATQAGASSFATGKATYTSTDFNGQTRRFEKVQPGQIRTVNDQVEYQFPASNIGAADYEIAINLLLRSVASRLAMPIWMLTSNVADMAAYTASLVAESHSVRMFQRLQAEQEDADLRVIWHAIEVAIEAGKLPKGTDEIFEIEVRKPQVEIRDTMKDAQVAQVLTGMRVMSPQKVSSDFNLDYEQEQANIEDHEQSHGGGLAGPVDLLGPPQSQTEGEYRVPFASLTECGGKGGKPGPCPTGRKERPKVGRTRGKKQPPPPALKDSVKSARAKASYNPASKEKQDASEAWEVKAAKELGLTKSGDNLPMDLTSADGKTAIEWKVVHDGKESRVNMRSDSRKRKEDQIKAKKQTAYTVIVDNRDKFEGGAHKGKFSGHNIYFKQGVGAFAFNTMDKAASLGDLKKEAAIMTMMAAIDGVAVGDVATNTGWRDFGDWVAELEGAADLRHLTEYGWFEGDLQLIEDQLAEAIESAEPTPDQKSVGDGMLTLVQNREPSATVIVVSDGIGEGDASESN